MKYIVQIIEHRTEKVIKEIECPTERKAEKIDDGVNINLNHENYYTKIRKDK